MGIEPHNIQSWHQGRAYRASAITISIGLALAGAVNVLIGNMMSGGIELVSALLLLLSTFFVKKGTHIELWGNTVLYSFGVLLLYIATRTAVGDPGPYAGLVALLIIASYMTVHHISFFLYGACIGSLFAAMSYYAYLPITQGGSLKFLSVYIVIFVLVSIQRYFFAKHDKEMLLYAEQMHEKGRVSIQKQQQREDAMVAMKEQAKILEQKNAELEEKTKELEHINELMVGREMRMVELKQRIAELEGQHT